MKNLEADNLTEVLAQHDKVFVQYGASWCGACQLIKPKVQELEKDYSDVEFIYVDAEKFPESRKLATVDNLPTFAFFKKGEFQKQVQASVIYGVKDLLNAVAGN